MKIYKVNYDVKGMYETESKSKFFVNKENAENFIKENDKPWTNMHGIEFHTARLTEIIETEDEKEAE